MFQEHSGLCSVTPSQERVTAAVWYYLGCLQGFTSLSLAGRSCGAQAIQLIQEEPPGISTPSNIDLRWGGPSSEGLLRDLSTAGRSWDWCFWLPGPFWADKVLPLMTRWFWDEIKPLGVIPSSSCLSKLMKWVTKLETSTRKLCAHPAGCHWMPRKRQERLSAPPDILSTGSTALGWILSLSSNRPGVDMLQSAMTQPTEPGTRQRCRGETKTALTASWNCAQVWGMDDAYC